MTTKLIIALTLTIVLCSYANANENIEFYNLYDYKATRVYREKTINTRLLLYLLFNKPKNKATTIMLADTIFDGRNVFTIPRLHQKELITTLSKAVNWAEQADQAGDKFFKLVGTIKIGVSIVFDRRDGISKIIIISDHLTSDFFNDLRTNRNASHLEISPNVAKLLINHLSEIDFTAVEESVRARIKKQVETENRYN